MSSNIASEHKAVHLSSGFNQTNRSRLFRSFKNFFYTFTAKIKST